MASDFFNQELIDACTQSVISSLLSLFTPLLPWLVGLIAVCVIFRTIKLIVQKMIFELSIVSGYSTRDAKKRAKFAGNLVDLISAFNDIYGSKK